MKKTLILSALLAIAACGGPKEQTTLDVVPHPNEVYVQEGTFDASDASVYYGNDLDERSKAAVNAFAQQLFLVSGSEGSVAEGASEKGIVFELDNALAHEAYAITVSPKKVAVKASGLNGFIYAIQTIKQMLPVEVFGNAPALGKPVLVLRRETERPEAVAAGTVRLAGTETEQIFKLAAELIECPGAYADMAHAVNPYGDGLACDRIVKVFL